MLAKLGFSEGIFLRLLEMASKYPAQCIQFHFLSSKIQLQNRKALKLFLVSIFKQEKTRLDSLTYVFCSDSYLLEINKEYLNHDYFTDIISFNLASPDAAIVGEIYISLDRVKDNANSLSESYKKELHRVIFHGALHLCGYKDKKPAEVNLMRSKEDEYLKKYFG